MTLTEEVMQAVFGAADDRKREALRTLKGEVPVGGGSRSEVRATEAYLTLREVARRLGISVCSLWRYGVPGHDFGGRRRFRMSEVEAYLESEEFRVRVAGMREGRAAEARACAAGRDGRRGRDGA